MNRQSIFVSPSLLLAQVLAMTVSICSFAPAIAANPGPPPSDGLIDIPLNAVRHATQTTAGYCWMVTQGRVAPPPEVIERNCRANAEGTLRCDRITVRAARRTVNVRDTGDGGFGSFRTNPEGLVWEACAFQATLEVGCGVSYTLGPAPAGTIYTGRVGWDYQWQATPGDVPALASDPASAGWQVSGSGDCDPPCEWVLNADNDLVERCKTNPPPDGPIETTTCPDGSAPVNDQCPTTQTCPDDSAPVNGQCPTTDTDPDPCEDGSTKVNGQCPTTPTCPDGSTKVNGQCPTTGTNPHPCEDGPTGIDMEYTEGEDAGWAPRPWHEGQEPFTPVHRVAVCKVNGELVDMPRDACAGYTWQPKAGCDTADNFNWERLSPPGGSYLDPPRKVGVCISWGPLSCGGDVGQ